MLHMRFDTKGFMRANMEDIIIQTVLKLHPDAQAVYIFGSFGAKDERPGSDVDIALLLPPTKAKAEGPLTMSALRFELEAFLKKTVDLINVRLVSTVFQKEIIFADRRIYTGDKYAAEEFEMLTLSFYQKLNEERREIMDEFYRTGRAYPV